MNKYLQEFLKFANTVIIPGLGALTITNDKTGEIFFMSYLKHDDSKLAEFIASKEQIELIDAKNNLAKYVREIIALLDKGESFDIFNFGEFIKDPSGEILFKQSTKAEYKLNESSYSTDVNEKLTSKLEITNENAFEKIEIVDQPSLDDLLKENTNQTIPLILVENNFIDLESRNSEKIEIEENASDKIESTSNNKINDRNEFQQELTSINSSFIVDHNIIESESIHSLNEVSEEKIVNVKSEELTTFIIINNESTQSIEENKNVVNSDTTIFEELTDKKIEITNPELISSSEKHTEIEIFSTTSKKNSSKKRIIGILIPLIIVSFAFFYPRYFKSSVKEIEKSQHEEQPKKKHNDAQKSKEIIINPSIETVKMDVSSKKSNIINSPITSATPAVSAKATRTKIVSQKNRLTYSSKTNITSNIKVIAGSFTKKENALKFNQLLIQKGYTNSSIFENGNNSLICLDSFPTIQEASNFARKLKLPTGYWLKQTK